MASQCRDRRLGLVGCNEQGKASLVCQVDDVYAKHFGAHGGFPKHRQVGLAHFHAAIDGARILMHHRAQAPTRDIADGADRAIRQRGEHGIYKAIQRRAVALDPLLEAQAFADRKQMDGVVAYLSAEDDAVARLNAGHAQRATAEFTNAGRIDEDLVCRALADDLGVAGDDLHACFLGRLADRADRLPQPRQRQTGLQDQAERQVAWGCAHDGEVVNGAADSDLADIAIAEEGRLNHERVRGDRKPLARQPDNRAILHLAHIDWAEFGRDHLDKLAAEPRTGPVIEDNELRRVILRTQTSFVDQTLIRNRANCIKWVISFHSFSRKICDRTVGSI